MLDLLLTLDYEGPGEGDGNIMTDVIEPTGRLMRICEGHGAKLTLFFEVGEYWAFCQAQAKGQLQHLAFDPGAEMRRQIQLAVKCGHDVQLHLHPQWLGFQVKGGAWKLDMSKVRLPALAADELKQVLAAGKETLECLLRPVRADYECFVFRAGNLCIQPETQILDTLASLGFRADSSVAPGMSFRHNEVSYEFPDENRRPYWRILDSVTRPNGNGKMWEVPITTRAMFPWQRDFCRKIRKLFRSPAQYDRPNVAVQTAEKRPVSKPMKSRYYRLDMSDSERTMTGMLKFFLQQSRKAAVFPVVMLGHAFALASAQEWEGFLGFCDEQAAAGNLRYRTFGDILPLLATNGG